MMGQDDAYWERFWSATGLTSSDLFELILPDDVRALRDKASGNLTTLCFKVLPYTRLPHFYMLPCFLLVGAEVVTSYIHRL